VAENGPAACITHATPSSIARRPRASSIAATRASTPSCCASARTFSALRPATIGWSPRSAACAASRRPE